MKILMYILIAVAMGLIIFNATKLDFDNLFEGDSAIAAIGILACACVIVLLLIFKMSKQLIKKTKR
jgi:hypothetical protein